MSTGSWRQPISPRMTWGPTVVSCEKKPNRTRRHDGWELPKLTDRGKKFTRPPKKTSQGKSWLRSRSTRSGSRRPASRACIQPVRRTSPAVRAHLDTREPYLSCRAVWMLLNRAPLWRQGSRTQPVDGPLDLSKQGSGDSDHCELKSDLTAMAGHLHNVGNAQPIRIRALSKVHPGSVSSDSSNHSRPNCRMWLKCPCDDRRFVRHLGNVSLEGSRQ